MYQKKKPGQCVTHRKIWAVLSRKNRKGVSFRELYISIKTKMYSELFYFVDGNVK